MLSSLRHFDTRSRCDARLTTWLCMRHRCTPSYISTFYKPVGLNDENVHAQRRVHAHRINPGDQTTTRYLITSQTPGNAYARFNRILSNPVPFPQRHRAQNLHPCLHISVCISLPNLKTSSTQHKSMHSRRLALPPADDYTLRALAEADDGAPSLLAPSLGRS